MLRSPVAEPERRMQRPVQNRRETREHLAANRTALAKRLSLWACARKYSLRTPLSEHYHRCQGNMTGRRRMEYSEPALFERALVQLGKDRLTSVRPPPQEHPNYREQGDQWPPACFAGENNETLILLAFPHSIARAMVSPRARPKPGQPPQNTPQSRRIITAQNCLPLCGPQAVAAIRSFEGTDTRASRLIAVMVGRIMMDKTRAAGAFRGRSASSKQRIHPSFTWSQLQVGRTRGITTNQPPQTVHNTRNCSQQNSIKILQQLAQTIRQGCPIRMEMQMKTPL